MKQLIKRLRQLEAAAGDWDLSALPDNESDFFSEMAKSLPQLLDRLEKLEVVAEAADSFCNTHCLNEGAVVKQFEKLRDAVAALDNNNGQAQS